MKTRIQVSIHPELVQCAQDNMAVRKYSSFSAYLEMLIREEYARTTAKAASLAPSPAFEAIWNASVAAASASAAQLPTQHLILPKESEAAPEKEKKLGKKQRKK